jgi:hypothetical protein
MNKNQIIKSMPSTLKAEIRKGFNGPTHAEIYSKLETYLGEQYCIYEDGTVYDIAKKIAGA